ncbi:MAG: hypothetical protein H7293_05845, partial [Candidatus Saccharibacteria bacterium]|nr:hypothetical protein [Rhodoferax sp.]
MCFTPNYPLQSPYKYQYKGPIPRCFADWATTLRRVIALIFGLCVAAIATAAAPDEMPLRIGSKRFTESYILAELLAQ